MIRLLLRRTSSIGHILTGAEDDVVDTVGVTQVCEPVPLDLTQSGSEAP